MSFSTGNNSSLNTMDSQAHGLHNFFFPLMAHGHTIPIIDIARLFASRGAKSTVITTPLNYPLFSDTIARSRQAGFNIGVEIIPFPAVEAGLPRGCESADDLTSPEMEANFNKALMMLQQPFDQLLQTHHPDCVVADMFLTWTTEIANKHGIPSLVFLGAGFFSRCLAHNIRLYTPYVNVSSDSEVFVVPGLPDPIQMTKSQLPDTTYNNWMDELEEPEMKSFGILVNSFYELEPDYADYFKKVMGRKAWHIGPTSLYNRNIIDKAQRGKKPTADEHQCLSWLDSKESNSVLYVSFGSLAFLPSAQLLEIAMGLEASQIPFISVVRVAKNKESEQFLPDGFEERTAGRGLIIRDWAPQVVILEHPAVGGFMTHCGWNSTLEGVAAGVPMITWPVFAEQFENKKLITQVLKIGVSAGNLVWNSWVEQESVTVTRDRVKEVVVQLMGEGEAAEDMRKRARQLADMAKGAMEEGGSSYSDLTALIEELKIHSQLMNETRGEVTNRCF